MEPCGIINCEKCPWPDCIVDDKGVPHIPGIKRKERTPSRIYEVHVYLPPEIYTRTEKLRGKMPRSRFVRTLAEMGLHVLEASEGPVPHAPAAPGLTAGRAEPPEPCALCGEKPCPGEDVYILHGKVYCRRCMEGCREKAGGF